MYPYTFITSENVAAAAFFEQFCVQGAWGVVPVHLMEVAQESLRTFVVGSAYQLGNLAPSASSTIEAKLGERYPLPSGEVKVQIVKRYNYGKVICVFLGAVYAFTIVLVVIGPEKRGRNFSVEFDEDMAEVTNGKHQHQDGDEEKAVVIFEERV